MLVDLVESNSGINFIHRLITEESGVHSVHLGVYMKKLLIREDPDEVGSLRVVMPKVPAARRHPATSCRFDSAGMTERE